MNYPKVISSWLIMPWESSACCLQQIAQPWHVTCRQALFFFVEQTSSVVEHVYLIEALQKHSKRYQIQVTLTSWPRGVDDNNPTTAQSKCASTQQ
jgi:hypothetical protein